MMSPFATVTQSFCQQSAAGFIVLVTFVPGTTGALPAKSNTLDLSNTSKPNNLPHTPFFKSAAAWNAAIWFALRLSRSCWYILLSKST